MMKTLIAMFVLLLAVSATADSHEQPGALDSVKDFLLGANPIILIVGGVLLFFASDLAKIIAVVLVALGLISLIMSII